MLQDVLRTIAFLSEKTAMHPPQKRHFMMFLRRYIVVFLGLCDSVSKGCHKATTPNGVPQGKGACDGIVCKLVLCLVYYSDGNKFI